MLLKLYVLMAVICFYVSHGRLMTIDEARVKLLKLQVKIEFTMTKTREDIHEELNKLDRILGYMKHRLDRKGEHLRDTVIEKKYEARSLGKSISHCMTGLKILTENLDLYNLYQCKDVPCHIQDTFLEAKKLTQSLHNKKSLCYAKYHRKHFHLRSCLNEVFSDINEEYNRIFRRILVHKSKMVSNGLTCIQNNFNTVVRELCFLTCQFEDCVRKTCKHSQKDEGDWDSSFEHFNKK